MQEIFFVLVRQSVAMVTTIVQKSCGSNNFYIIQANKFKFSIYDNPGVVMQDPLYIYTGQSVAMVTTCFL